MINVRSYERVTYFEKQVAEFLHLQLVTSWVLKLIIGVNFIFQSETGLIITFACVSLD